MRTPNAPTILVAVLAISTATVAAVAQKIGLDVTPANAAAAGFAVTVAPREGGALRFTVVRDVAKAEWPARDAWLEVHAAGKLLAKCDVQEHPTMSKQIAYSFDMSRESAEGSTLTVTEVETADGKPDGIKVLGGGTYYHFRLADFAPKPARAVTSTTDRHFSPTPRLAAGER